MSEITNAEKLKQAAIIVAKCIFWSVAIGLFFIEMHNWVWR